MSPKPYIMSPKPYILHPGLYIPSPQPKASRTQPIESPQPKASRTQPIENPRYTAQSLVSRVKSLQILCKTQKSPEL